MEQEKLKAALEKLDRTNDNHWTKEGQPNLVAVRFLAGDQKITREDIEAVMPGMVRLQEKSDAAAGSSVVGGNAAPETESKLPEAGDEEEDLLKQLERAKGRLAEAKARKAEADREHAQATAEVDRLIELTEKDMTPQQAFAEAQAAYQKTQQMLREQKAARLADLRGVPIREILPQVRSPLDAALGQKKSRPAPGRE